MADKLALTEAMIDTSRALDRTRRRVEDLVRLANSEIGEDDPRGKLLIQSLRTGIVQIEGINRSIRAALST